MNFFLRHKRTILLGIADGAVAIFSCLLTYFIIKFIDERDSQNVYILLTTEKVLAQSAILVTTSVAGMWLCGVYNNIWRYASIFDFVKCIGGVLAGVAMYYVVVLALKLDYPDIYSGISSLIIITGVMLLRAFYAYIYRKITQKDSKSKNRTMVIGGGDAGQKVIVEMSQGNSGYKPIVVVDDDIDKIGRRVRGIKIAGTTDDIPRLAEEMNIDTILFAIPSCDAEKKKRILNICSETVCKVKKVPFLHELIANANLLDQQKDIDVADLLGREQIKLDDAMVAELVEGKTCMVTGGGGSIGSELCRQIAQYSPHKLVIVDIYENNAYNIQQELLNDYPELDLDVCIASVRDYDKMDNLFNEYRPELVYHAAAHKHVPLMETSPEEAIKNNIVGTFNSASLANKYKVRKFVLVSTDKAVNPTNVMGATKRFCEMIVQYFSQISEVTEFVAVRFGNVLGSNGSVIPLFEKQIAHGGPLTVTHRDIIRYFMTIPEAVSLILQAGTIARGGEIFVLDMGEPVKILSLAENLIKLHGKEPYTDIDIQFTGLRPGEKLFEELLMAEEGLRETENKKIFIGKQIEIDEKTFLDGYERIKQIAETNDSESAVEALAQMVPTFHHVKVK